MPGARPPVSIRGPGGSPSLHSPQSSTCSQVGWLSQGGTPALSNQADSIQHHGQIQLLPQPEPEQKPPSEKMSQTKEAQLWEAEER